MYSLAAKALFPALDPTLHPTLLNPTLLGADASAVFDLSVPRHCTPVATCAAAVWDYRRITKVGTPTSTSRYITTK